MFKTVKFAKLFLVTLLLLSILSTSVLVWAEKSNNADEVYYEIEEYAGNNDFELIYDGKDINYTGDKNKSYKIVQKNSASFNKESEVSAEDLVTMLNKNTNKDEQFKNLVNKKLILAGSVKKAIYIEVDNNTKQERKLTVGEIDKIKEFKAKNNEEDIFLSNNTIGNIKDIFKSALGIIDVHAATTSKSIYRLYQQLDVVKDYYSNSKYYLTGYATWTGFSNSIFNSKEFPSNGDDALVFSWGGSYDYSDVSLLRTYIDTNTGAESTSLGTVRNVSGQANVSRGWAYPEFVPTGYHLGSYCRNAKAYATLSKPSLSGGTTKVYLSYAHTFSTYNTSYSFSVPQAATISVTPATDYWTDFVELTINQ